MNNYAVIMAGGVGTRFWPKGTSKLPKQFLKIIHDSNSMIQETYQRLTGLVHSTKVFVVTNVMYKNDIKKQLPQIPDENIICEPFGRNTAPCIGLACLFLKQFDEKANVIVLPSDHVIGNVEEFQHVLKTGLAFVNENGGIVTLGINPTKPETGYGYIQFDLEKMVPVAVGDERHEKVFKVKTFAEKPNLDLAKAFIESGDFLWNSGMFIFRVDTMMNEIQSSLPDIFESLMHLEGSLMDKDFDKKLEFEYSKMKGISIDYGVMEKSHEVYTIKSDFGWSDVGSWDEIYNIKEKDVNGNVKVGKTVTIDTKNCLIINDQKIAATIGVEDLLIIDTDNGLLVCKRGESQKVKDVVDYLRRKGMNDYL
ncbi:MAG: mannose-1-phosphate guanylyltransferase [Ignavibacteriae bacterium]|nr:mannose-1-phosphate guanylyltransferase [Ignavibacteriota bacterium]MCB9244648.1 mannose-1-phosphate guanylyltransferase [Ignavibacteriales bacterium]